MSVKFERPDGFVADLPNCGVVALAIVTGQSYATIWEWAKARRNRTARWKGRMFTADLEPAMRRFKTRFYRADPRPKRVTLGAFAELHTIKGRTYLIRVPGHFLTLKDGIVIDNSRKSPRPVIDYSARKVTHAWRILEKGER